MTKKNTTKKTTEPVINSYPELPTKSARIRAMTADGHERTVIAKAIGIIYQHVRNVQLTPLKRDLEKKA